MAVSNSSTRFLFDILEVLGAADAPLGLTEIRKRLNLPVATAHRGLATLEHAGFAERYQASTRYVLGPMARRLRQSVVFRFALRDRALPYLRRLSVTTGETASFSVRIGWYLVRLITVRGQGDVMPREPTGATKRLDEEFSGRVILSLLPDQERADFRSFCHRTHQRAPRAPVEVDRSALLETGFVTEPGPVSLVAPLHDRSNTAAAVIAVELQDGAAWSVRGTAAMAELTLALRQIRKALEPIETHYNHIDPNTIDLSGFAPR